MVDNMKVLICSVYMPCDMQISRVSGEYIDTLNCLETLLQGNSYSEVLLGEIGIQIFHGEILKAES